MDEQPQNDELTDNEDELGDIDDSHDRKRDSSALYESSAVVDDGKRPGSSTPGATRVACLRVVCAVQSFARRLVCVGRRDARSTVHSSLCG